MTSVLNGVLTNRWQTKEAEMTLKTNIGNIFKGTNIMKNMFWHNY